MGPQSILGQLNQSMQSGQPALNQVSGSSPNFDPGMQPPQGVPMPDKSPASLLHKAAMSRGLDISQHPQMQPGQEEAQPTSAAAPQDPPGDGVINMPVTEAQLIIKALSGRLKTVSGHEEKLRDAALSMIQPQEASNTPQ